MNYNILVLAVLLD